MYGNSWPFFLKYGEDAEENSFSTYLYSEDHLCPLALNLPDAVQGSFISNFIQLLVKEKASCKFIFVLVFFLSVFNVFLARRILYFCHFFTMIFLFSLVI